jgi:hypothetical protein
MAKKPDSRTPYDPAKAARDRNAMAEAPAPPAMTLQQRLAARRPYLRPEKKPLLRAED